MNKKQKKILIRIIISAAITVGLFFMPDVGIYKLLLFLIPYFIAGFDIVFKAIKGLIRFQPFNENFLMVFATIGAFVLGEYTEGCAVMIFYQIGELFQKIAVGKSRKSISKLLDLRPDSARVESADGSIVSVAPEEVEIGSVLVIRVGEKVPIDGIVIDGSTSLNLAALTGESIPKDVSVDDEVISGSLNLTGVIKIKTTKKFGESTVSKILELVENATSKKSKSENFISKFAKYYTPAVCISAVVVAVVPPLIRIAMGLLPFWGDWVYRALTFLVISCPCALVISIPLGFFAGIGGAGSVGVLVKGSNYLEALSKVKCVVFDKTGTVTKGEFAVVGVLNENINAETLIEIVAAAESFSSHPISKSIVKAYGKKIDNSKVCDIIELSGYGVKAIVDGKTVYAGNDKLMEEICVPYKKCNHVETVVYVVIDGVYSGCILVSDTLKPQAAEAVAELKKQGVKKIAMLTGDTKIVAADTAKKLGIDEVYGELLPQDKVEKIEELLKDVCSGEKLAFVGDGINDAPALMRSDVGIAMGGVGSDSAIEAADVVLMDDNPARIPKAIKIARKCMKIVYQNIVFALGVKFICLLLGLLGITNMWLAIFADVGVMVLATLNAIRALYVKKI